MPPNDRSQLIQTIKSKLSKRDINDIQLMQGSDKAGRPTVIATFSGSNHSNVFSVEINVSRAGLLLNGYLIPQQFGGKGSDSIIYALETIRRETELASQKYHSVDRSKVVQAANDAFRTFTGAGTHISADWETTVRTGALSNLEYQVPPTIIGNKNLFATHNTDESLIDNRGIDVVWHPSSGSRSASTQRVGTLQQIEQISGVVRSGDGKSLISPFGRFAKASRTTAKNFPLTPAQENANLLPMVRTSVKQANVNDIEEPLGSLAIHPFWVAYSNPGAADINKDYQDLRYVKNSVKTHPITFEDALNVTLGRTGRVNAGEPFGSIGDKQLKMRSNINIESSRVVIPRTSEGIRFSFEARARGMEINPDTSLPYGYAWGGTGNRPEIQIQTSQSKYLHQIGGVSVKSDAFKSFAYLRDTRGKRTPIRIDQNEGVVEDEWFRNPVVEGTWESAKGAVGLYGVGLVLGHGSPYRQKALEELRINRPELYKALRKGMNREGDIKLNAKNYPLIGEAAAYLFYEREYSTDLPFGGKEFYYHPVIGTAARQGDVPPSILSFLKGDPMGDKKSGGVGGGFGMVQHATKIGTARKAEIVWIRGNQIIGRNQEILDRQNEIQYGDKFQQRGYGRASIMGFAFAPRESPMGRKPRFSGDEITMQANRSRGLAEFMFGEGSLGARPYRDVFAASAGGSTPNSDRISISHEEAPVLRKKYEKLLGEMRSGATPENATETEKLSAFSSLFGSNNSFIQIGDSGIFEPLSSIAHFSHSNMEGKESSKLVRNYVRAMEGYLLGDSAMRESHYRNLARVRNNMMANKGMIKAMTSSFPSTAIEGPYQIDEEVPAGSVVLGSHVIRGIQKIVLGRRPNREEVKAFEESLTQTYSIWQRRPGVNFDQAAQIAGVIPQSKVASIGLRPSEISSRGIYLGGGGSFENPQKADSDADRIVGMIFTQEQWESMSERTRGEVRTFLAEIISGQRTREMAQSNYSKEYDPNMSNAELGLMGGADTQFESAKKSRDWTKFRNWVANVIDDRPDDPRHANWRFTSGPNKGKLMREMEDPTYKLFLGYEQSIRGVLADYIRYAQFKDRDVGFTYVMATTARRIMEEVGDSTPAVLARGMQSAWSMTYQAALDVSKQFPAGTLVDIAKTMTFGTGKYRPSNLGNKAKIEKVMGEDNLLPPFDKFSGIGPNLAKAMIQEYEYGNLTAEDVASKYTTPEIFDEVVALLQGHSPNNSNTLARMIGTFGRMSQKDIFTNTLAGKLVLAERAEKWESSPSFKDAEPWLKKLITKEAAKSRAISSGLLGRESTDLIALDELSKEDGAFGWMARTLLGVIDPRANLVQKLRPFESAEEAMQSSMQASQAYWSIRMQEVLKEKEMFPNREMSDILKHSRDKVGDADMNVRSPSQLGRSTLDLVERSLTSNDQRYLIFGDQMRRAMIRGDIAGTVVQEYLKQLGNWRSELSTGDLPLDHMKKVVGQGYLGFIDLYRPSENGGKTLILDVKSVSGKEEGDEVRKARLKAKKTGSDVVMAPGYRGPQVQAYMLGDPDTHIGGILYLPKKSWSTMGWNETDAQGNVTKKNFLTEAVEQISNQASISVHGINTNKEVRRLEKELFARSDVQQHLPEMATRALGSAIEARISPYSQNLDFARKYYETINGIVTNLMDRGILPRKIDHRDPNFRVAYQEAQRTGANSNEAYAIAMKETAQHYNEIAERHIKAAGVTVGDYKDMPWLVGTPLEREHKVLIEIPSSEGSHREVADYMSEEVQGILRANNLSNPLVLRTSSKDREILEFSVPDNKIGEAPRWESWLKGTLKPFIKSITPDAGYYVMSPANQERGEGGPLGGMANSREQLMLDARRDISDNMYYISSSIGFKTRWKNYKTPADIIADLSDELKFQAGKSDPDLKSLVDLTPVEIDAVAKSLSQEFYTFHDVHISNRKQDDARYKKFVFEEGRAAQLRKREEGLIRPFIYQGPNPESRRPYRGSVPEGRKLQTIKLGSPNLGRMPDSNAAPNISATPIQNSSGGFNASSLGSTAAGVSMGAGSAPNIQSLPKLQGPSSGGGSAGANPPPNQPNPQQPSSGNQHWMQFMLEGTGDLASSVIQRETIRSQGFNMAAGFNQNERKDAVGFYRQLQAIDTALRNPKDVNALRKGISAAQSALAYAEKSHAGRGSNVAAMSDVSFNDVSAKLKTLTDQFVSATSELGKFEEATQKAGKRLDDIIGPKYEKIMQSAQAGLESGTGMNKPQMLEMMKAIDPLSKAAAAGSSKAGLMLSQIQNMFSEQQALRDLGVQGVEEVPKEIKSRSKLRRMADASDAAMDEIAFGNTAFRMRMAWNLTTGAQGRWMQQFLGDQATLSQAAIMTGATPMNGDELSRYVIAANKMYNTRMRLGEGASQVMVPLSEMISGIGGGQGLGSALTIGGYGLGIGLTSSYAINAAKNVLPAFGATAASFAPALGSIAAPIGLGIGAGAAGLLGVSYLASESKNWYRYQENTYPREWREAARFLTDFGRPTGEPFKVVTASQVRDTMASEKSAYSKTFQARVDELQKWLEVEYPNIKSPDAAMSLAQLQRLTGLDKNDPTLNRFMQQWTSFLSAGANPSELVTTQTESLKYVGAPQGSQRAIDWMNVVSATPSDKLPSTFSAAQLMSGYLGNTGDTLSNSDIDLLTQYRAIYGDEEGSKRYIADTRGYGSFSQTYRTIQGSNAAYVGETNRSLMWSNMNLTIPQLANKSLAFREYAARIGPQLQASGSNPQDIDDLLQKFFDKYGSDKEIQVQNLAVVANQVGLETKKTGDYVLNQAEQNNIMRLPEGSREAAIRMQEGAAGLAPLGYEFGTPAAQAWETKLAGLYSVSGGMSQIQYSAATRATELLRRTSETGQYSEQRAASLGSSFLKYRPEDIEFMEKFAGGAITVGGLPKYSSAAGKSAILLSGASGIQFNDYNKAAKMQEFANFSSGIISTASTGFIRGLSSMYSALQRSSGIFSQMGAGIISPQRANWTNSLAFASTGQQIAQAIAQQVEQSSGIQLTPGLQTQDIYGLPYGEYTPWVSVNDAMQGQGFSSVGQYESWLRGKSYDQQMKMLSPYTHEPMYMQQFQLQMAQLGGQRNMMQLDYVSTFGGSYGGTNYYGSSNYARDLQWGRGPFVPMDQLLAARNEERSAWQGDGTFQFSGNVGDSQISIARQESAIRWEMSLKSIQWRKEDLAFAQQSLEISRKQLQLSKEEAATRHEFSVRQREEDRGFSLRQREWKREDFGIQRSRTAVENQWAEDDARRALRFASGREAIQLRREIERQRIRRGWQQDDMSRQESRAEEAFQAEDKRYKLAVEMEEKMYEFTLRNFALQEEKLNIEAAKLAAAAARLAQEEAWTLEQMALDDKRFKLQMEQFIEEEKKQKTIYDIRSDILAAEYNLAVEQNKNKENLIASLMKQQEITETISKDEFKTGADKLIAAINAIEGFTPPPWLENNNGSSGGSGSGDQKSRDRYSGPRNTDSGYIPIQRSTSSGNQIVVQFVLDGDVIAEKVVSESRIEPIISEINEKKRWRS